MSQFAFLEAECPRHLQPCVAGGEPRACRPRRCRVLWTPCAGDRRRHLPDRSDGSERVARNAFFAHASPSARSICVDRIVGWVEFFTRPNYPNREMLGLAQGSTQPTDEGGSSLRAVRRPVFTPPLTRASSRCRPTARGPARSRRHSPRAESGRGVAPSSTMRLRIASSASALRRASP